MSSKNLKLLPHVYPPVATSIRIVERCIFCTRPCIRRTQGVRAVHKLRWQSGFVREFDPVRYATSLLTFSLDPKICWLKLFGKFPMDMRIPPSKVRFCLNQICCNGWPWQLLLMRTKLCAHNYMQNISRLPYVIIVVLPMSVNKNIPFAKALALQSSSINCSLAPDLVLWILIFSGGVFFQTPVVSAIARIMRVAPS